MDSTEIQKRVDAIAKAMVAKGRIDPAAEAQIGSDVIPCVCIRWGDWENKKYHFERRVSFEEVLDAGDAFVRGLSSVEEEKLHDFMGALGKVIDLGRKNGVEADYLNPLVASMKKLSENVITHDRAA